MNVIHELFAKLKPIHENFIHILLSSTLKLIDLQHLTISENFNLKYTNMMQQLAESDKYEAPTIEIIKTRVEKGFSSSGNVENPDYGGEIE